MPRKTQNEDVLLLFLLLEALKNDKSGKMNFDYAGSKLRIKPAAAQKRYARLKQAVFNGQTAASKGNVRKMDVDGESP